MLARPCFFVIFSPISHRRFCGKKSKNTGIAGTKPLHFSGFSPGTRPNPHYRAFFKKNTLIYRCQGRHKRIFASWAKKKCPLAKDVIALP